MSKYTLTITKYNNVDLLNVAGRIDSSNATEFDNELKALYQHGRKQLVLELSGIEFMSSAGLRALVAAQRECEGDVAIATPSSRVADLLDLAGLNSVFAVYDDVTEAVGSFT